MAYAGPFTPGRTLTLEVGPLSVAAPIHPDSPQVSLLNIGPGLAFVAFSVGPAEADATGFPLPVGVPVMLTKGVGADTIAAVVPAAVSALMDPPGTSAMVFVTPGSGA